MTKSAVPTIARVLGFVGLLGLIGLLAVSGPGPALGRGVCDGVEPGPAEVVFVARALEGSVDPSTGELLSPARFRVERWVVGERRDSPKEVEVVTAVSRRGDLIQGNSIGITPRPGERWEIVGRRGPDGVIETSVCDGSERVVEEAAGERAAPEPAPERTPGPGDDRLLSLAVAAAGATALSVSLSRRL